MTVIVFRKLESFIYKKNHKSTKYSLGLRILEDSIRSDQRFQEAPTQQEVCIHKMHS